MLSSASHLPFNLESFEGRFVPAAGSAAPVDREGHWFLIQNQHIFLLENRDGAGRIPRGAIPSALDGHVESIVHFGTYLGVPCWAGTVEPGVEPPMGFVRERLAPGQIQLSDDLLSLCGLGQQATYWDATSWHCPRCGEQTVSIRGERGKRCLRCKYDHYPHLPPGGDRPHPRWRSRTAHPQVVLGQGPVWLWWRDLSTSANRWRRPPIGRSAKRSASRSAISSTSPVSTGLSRAS